LEFRQLIPEASAVEVADLLAGLALGDRAGPERPYTIVNFIASADGRATFRGRSGALGDKADRDLFHGLREQADAVLVGTVTMRTERYGRLVRDPERRRRRTQAGRTPEPLACVVTRSGEVPREAPLFSEPEARIVVFSSEPVDLAGARAQVELVPVDMGELTLTTVLRLLRSEFGIGLLLCEGGPTMFGALLEERLVDELFLTLAPKLAGGGTSPTIATGPELAELEPLELVWALEHSSALYLRYAVG
jgi:5-amino-6-(5-phosphoribosylamino)uracil reductase